MVTIITYLGILITATIIPVIVTADEQQLPQYNRPPQPATASTGFTVGKQYNLDAKVLKDGTASGSLYAVVGGQVGPGPNYYTNPSNDNLKNTNPTSMTSPSGYYYDSTQAQPLSQGSGTSLWSSSNVNYYVAGGVFVIVLLCYGVWTYFFDPYTFTRIGNVDEDNEVEIPVNKDTKKILSKKTRRRRAIRRNEEAARLASIVLSAIESGECLQRSICLMGSQIGGTDRGKLALTVLDKLVPQSVQGNDYYVILKKALKGEGVCDQFRCKY